MAHPLRPASKRKVLHLLRTHHRLSRAQLASALDVTHAGVARIITGLSNMGLIRELQPKAQGDRGRPSRHIELNGPGAFGLGITLSTEGIRLGLIDLKNQWVADTILANPFVTDHEPNSPAIKQLTLEIQAWVQKTLPGKQRLRLLGGMFSAAGYMPDKSDRFEQINLGADTPQALQLVDRLHELLGVPIGQIVDVDAHLLAERWLGKDMPPQPNLMLLNSRSGFAMMVNGRPASSLMQPGRSYGDLHLQLDCHPERASKDGCLGSIGSMSYYLDTLAGAPYGKRYRYLGDHRDIEIKEVDEFYRRYEAGDPVVREMVEKGFAATAIAVRNLLMLFRIDQIVLMGWRPSVMNDGIACMQTILHSFPYQLLARVGPPKVRAASLGQRQEVAGAALAALEAGLSNKRLVRLASQLRGDKNPRAHSMDSHRLAGSDDLE